MEQFDSEEGLETSSLFSLEWERLSGEMFEVYNIIRGIDMVDCRNPFPISEIDKTRGHALG